MIVHLIKKYYGALALACCLTIALTPCLVQAGGLTALRERPTLRLDLPDLERRPRSLDEFSGQVVLVNFWASWCTPCVTEMPSIRRLERALRDEAFAVIGVNVAEGERRAAAATKRLDLDFLVLLDTEGEAFAAWQGQVLPTSYLLDRRGQARYIALGPLEWDDREVQETVRRLLEESSGRALASE